MPHQPQSQIAPALILALASAVLAGCASQADIEKLKLQPGYAQGYADGCLTVSEEEKSFSLKTKRDEYEFENDKAYQAGWRFGYQECSSSLPAPNNGGRILGDRASEDDAGRVGLY